MAVTFVVTLSRVIGRREVGGIVLAVSLPHTPYLREKQKGCRTSVLRGTTTAEVKP